MEVALWLWLALATAVRASSPQFPKEEPMASRRPTDSSRPTTTPTPPADPESPPPTAAKAKASTVRKPRAKKDVTAKVSIAGRTIEITDDVRRGMIAEAAYLRAERRGFSGGHEREREDWLAAEAEVDALLKAGQGTSAQ
jgi:hypothetical protein